MGPVRRGMEYLLGIASQCEDQVFLVRLDSAVERVPADQPFSEPRRAYEERLDGKEHQTVP